MKKMNVFLSTLAVLSLSLVGCGKSNDSQNPATDSGTNQPQQDDVVIKRVEFTGLDDIVVNQGDNVNVKSGVRVTGFYDDGDAESSFIITSYVTVTQGNLALNNNIADTREVGEYELVYTVGTITGYTYAAGVTLSATRNLTVNSVEVSGVELITNGDFSDGGEHWANYTDGSIVSFDFSEGYMKCIETSVSGNSYSPRLNTPYPNSAEAFSLVYGATYQLSFRAKADAPKTIRTQIGTILPSAPWWIEYHDENGDGLINDYNLTTSWETYRYNFTFSDNTAEEVHLTIEMGTVNGDSTATTIYVDDISLKAAGEMEDSIAPKLAGIDDVSIDLSTSSATGNFDPLAGVTATDNVDDASTLTINYEIKNEANETVNAIPLNQPGKYTIKYSVTDAAGNTREETRKVVLADFSTLTNLVPSIAGVFHDENGTYSQDQLDTDNVVNTWYVWTTNAAWGLGGHITATASLVGDSFNITASGLAANPNTWSIQGFFKVDASQAGDYYVTAKVNVDTARKIDINGNVIDLKAGDNDISAVVANPNNGRFNLIVLMGGGELASTDATTVKISNLSVALIG